MRNLAILVLAVVAATALGPGPASAGLGLSLDLGAAEPPRATGAYPLVDLERAGALDTPFLVDEDGDRMVGDLGIEEGANLTITTGDLRCAACIHTPDMADAAVVTAKLAAGAVTEPKLADGAVSTRALAAGAVTEPKLADGAVSTRALAAGAVTEPKLAPGSASTRVLADGAVTEAKLATGAVGARAIADGSVGYADLAPEVLRPVTILSGLHPTGSTGLIARTLHPMATGNAADDPSDAHAKGLVVRRAGALTGFVATVSHNGLMASEAMVLTVRVNGADTAMQVVVPAGAPPGTALESAAEVPVQRGDRVTLHAATGTPSARFMGFGWTLEFESR